MSTRVGNYAITGQSVFTLVDSPSFYVIGCFEETKLRHSKSGVEAHITLYNDNHTLTGKIASIGHAIYGQSVETDSQLVPDVRPNIPWVRLAQRVPVRISPNAIPSGVILVSGTTCTVSMVR